MMTRTRSGGPVAGHVFDGDAAHRLLDEYDAASLLALSVKTLRRWRWAGTGPAFVRLGRAVRYHQDDLNAFIKAGRRRSTADASE